MDNRNFIAKRAAAYFQPGDVVNLGIGLPTLVPAYLPEGVHVILQSENGIIGTGAKPTPADSPPRPLPSAATSTPPPPSALSAAAM